MGARLVSRRERAFWSWGWVIGDDQHDDPRNQTRYRLLSTDHNRITTLPPKTAESHRQ